MRHIINKRLITGIFFVALILISGLLSGSCTARDDIPPDGEGFAIYLTRDDIPPARMDVRSDVEIAEEPVLAVRDIKSYDAVTHEMNITTEAYERINELEVTTQGKSFLVCVDKNPIYWGAFWAPFSSVSFDGVTIWQTYGYEPGKIKLELGYPGAGFFRGKDPRNNIDVMKSLERAGKLVNEISVTLVDSLPYSMKGYELYSWQDDEEWHFKLMTGTNRNKTLEEIIRREDGIIDMADIHVDSIDGIKTVLSKLPEGEDVFWLTGARIADTSESEINLTLPGKAVRDDIVAYAERCGLELIITAPQ